jgi:DNA-binding Lrp family transcriptional regulator
MNDHLDEKDIKILNVLKEHAEYTTRQIAKKTLLPPTTIHNRIRKMRRDKIIKKFTVELDQSKIDRGFMTYILVSCNLSTLKQKKKTQYDVAKALKKLDHVERADIVSGGADIVATVRVKDVSEFDTILLKKIQLIDGIENTQSLIVLHS